MSFLTGNTGSVNDTNPPAAALRVDTALAGQPKPRLWGTTRIPMNLVYWNNLNAIEVNTGGGAGGKGGAPSSPQQRQYLVDFIAVLASGPITNINTVWVKGSATSLSNLNLNLSLGEQSSPVIPLEGNLFGYSRQAAVWGSQFNLGTDASMPQITFEATGEIFNGGYGSLDVDPAQILPDYLTNTANSIGFPPAFLGDYSGTGVFSNYCRAQGIFISAFEASQRAISDFLTEFATTTNSAFVWSSGLLSSVPYGDQPLSGPDGSSYTPPSPVYNLGDDDFIYGNSSSAGGASPNSVDPVVPTIIPYWKLNNDVNVEFLDRSNSYNPNTVEQQDEAAQQVWGLRSRAKDQLHMIQTSTVAAIVASLILGREQITTKYQFTLGPWAIMLDPMDIVTLTHAAVGLNQHWVRITEIQEDDNGNLLFTAEDFNQGAGTNSAITPPTSSSSQIPWNAHAPAITAATLMEFPPQTLGQTAGDLAVWAGVCGPSPGSTTNWGGYLVYVSSDGGQTYAVQNSGVPTYGNTRMGVLSANFATGVDPDVINTLSVDMTESQSSMNSGIQSDADRDITACYVDGEVVAYTTATLTSQYKYNLGGYLRRGQYGTPIGSHVAGSPFVMLQNSVLTKIPYQPNQVGQQILIKFVSVNPFGGGAQSLDNVTPVAYTIKGPGIPGVVQNFQVSPVGNAVKASWLDLNDFGSLKGYSIGYAAPGTALNPLLFEEVTVASRATEVTTVSIPPGTWLVGIWGVNIAGQNGPMSVVTVSVPNPNDVVETVSYAPDWLGTLNGFVRHYSGLLIPDSAVVAQGLTMAQLFTQFVPYPVPNPTFEGSVIDALVAASVRAWETSSIVLESSALPPADTTMLLDVWGAGADPLNFQPWTINQITGRFFRGGITEATASIATPRSVAVEQSPDWLGASTNFVRHYSGLLIPESTHLASALTMAQLFTQFVPFPASTCTYTSGLIDAGAIETGLGAITHGETGATNVQTSLDSWSSGPDPNTFAPFINGSVTARFLRTRYSQSTSPLGPQAVSEFGFTLSNPALVTPNSIEAVPIASLSLTVDAQVTTQPVNGLTVAPGGSTFTFASLGIGPYHAAPNVQVTPTGGATGGGALATTTSVTVHVYTGSTDTGGTCNLIVIGA